MTKLLDIILHPNPILRKKSVDFDLKKLAKPEIKELLVNMEETMKKKDGAGLAAPQIGLNIRVIVINNEKKTLFLINPKITRKSWARAIEDEGCLSVIDDKGEIIYGRVARHKKIDCSYFDEQGKKKNLEAKDILARVIQHEIDHLDGILFIDRLENLQPSQSALNAK